MAPGRVPGAITTVNSSTPVTDIMSVLLANEYCVENSLKFYEHQSSSFISSCVSRDTRVSPLPGKELHYQPLPKNFFKFTTVNGKTHDLWNITEDMLEHMSKEDIIHFQSVGKRIHEYCYDSVQIF